MACAKWYGIIRFCLCTTFLPLFMITTELRFNPFQLLFFECTPQILSFLTLFLSTHHKQYEARLKQENPGVTDLQYDMADLVCAPSPSTNDHPLPPHPFPQLAFIESLTDLSLMIFDQSTRLYRPFGKDWVVNKVYSHLRKCAS